MPHGRTEGYKAACLQFLESALNPGDGARFIDALISERPHISMPQEKRQEKLQIAL